MATPSRSSKQSSRWGSLLQQAVAGVESRLDNILAEDDKAGEDFKAQDLGTQESESGRNASTASTPAAESKPRKSLSRSPSSSRAQDRLQERLAKAMVKNNSIRNDGSSGTPSGVSSRAASPVVSTASPRSSLDNRSRSIEVEATKSYPATTETNEREETRDLDGSTQGSSFKNKDIPQQPSAELGTRLPSSLLASTVSPKPSIESKSSAVSRQPTEITQERPVTQNFTDTNLDARDTDSEAMSPADYQAIIAQMKSDYEVCELRRQEEMHSYMERIDALQAKLQYLSREIADSAKQTSFANPPGSLERKLAEREEQIALIMEEGQKLSKQELKHINTIKSLRAKASEDSKNLLEGQRRWAKVEKDLQAVKEKARRAENAEKQAKNKLKSLSNLEKELENMKAGRDSSNALLATLRSQLSEATKRAEVAEKEAKSGALEAERTAITELQDDLSNARIEKQISEEKYQSEINGLKGELEREKERSHLVEVELRREQSALERRIETLRSHAEEVSAGATGDAQVKLLRQIETLQTQYAVASENWQGIEGALLSRVADLEKERDELSKREGEARRRAREVTQKMKRIEEELEKARDTLHNTEQDFSESKLQLERLQQKLMQLNTSFIDARAEHDRERQAWDSEMRQRNEEYGARWKGEEPQALVADQHLRPESPATPNRKHSASDLLYLHMRRAPGRSIAGDTSASAYERPSSRRASGQPLRPEFGTPPRQDSLPSLPQHGSIPETPSIHAMENEDFFNGVITPSSPHRTVNDVISASTVGTGPSVQLVERMSAAVRRLESEKAATEEELVRLCAQRDEAREEVVALMREVEEKRNADERIKRLELHIVEMDKRYQTTLEMLGEKSEQVEEQRADIADLKKIYRELVESTMR
ncbi:MAG: hypothetical protein M1819_000111 [Sarea resinae]|nr:MAG: hypothetical protein M1819_000111 [Sarea resinae]